MSKSVRIDMTGNIYNSWKINYYSHTVGKVVFWNCTCLDCNKEYVVKGQNVRIGLSKQCVSCGHKTTTKKQIGVNKIRDVDLAIFRYLKYFYKKGANKRGHIFSLTTEDVKELVLKNCAYCGSEPSNKCYPMKHVSLSQKNSNRHIIRNGIDRVDSAKGYTLDNVVPCCATCNSAKNDTTKADFLAWIERVYRFNKPSST